MQAEVMVGQSRPHCASVPWGLCPHAPSIPHARASMFPDFAAWKLSVTKWQKDRGQASRGGRSTPDSHGQGLRAPGRHPLPCQGVCVASCFRRGLLCFLAQEGPPRPSSHLDSPPGPPQSQPIPNPPPIHRPPRSQDLCPEQFFCSRRFLSGAALGERGWPPHPQL